MSTYDPSGAKPGRRSEELEARLERKIAADQSSRPRQFPASTVKAFGLALIGGAVATAAGMPLGWLLGALVALAAWNLIAGRLIGPKWFRMLGQCIVGLNIGLGLTAATVDRLASLSGYMLLAALLAIGSAIAIGALLAKLAGIDRTTAYFASVPGGVAEMAILAEHRGGQPALVALAQSLRIVVVVLSLPTLAYLAGWGGTMRWEATIPEVRLDRLIPMLLLGAATAYALNLLNVRNNWLLGGIAIGGIVAYFDLPGSAVPHLLMVCAQVMVGCVLGSTFTRETLGALRSFLPLTMLATCGLLILTSATAIPFSIATGASFGTMMLSLAPGGVVEMGLTATALHLDTAEVTAFHLVRIVLILLLTDPIFRLMRWLRRK